ncbi:MAG: hypothetical protein RI980_1145 [Bacteroidota bacterium]|jgi:hypothetical protein
MTTQVIKPGTKPKKDGTDDRRNSVSQKTNQYTTLKPTNTNQKRFTKHYTICSKLQMK